MALPCDKPHKRGQENWFASVLLCRRRWPAIRDKVDAVQRMQDYIESHLEEPIRLSDLSNAAGYTYTYATRIFKELVGISPIDYLRARRLSRAAMQLRDFPGRILDIALDTAFDSHEGFTRAFARYFGVTPEYYRKNTPPVRLFMPRSARGQYLHYLESKGEQVVTNSSAANTVFVQAVERPARKLILQRAKAATHYFEYCEELGCDVWGVLTSIKGALYEPIGMWLPDNLRAPGTGEYAQGVEVPVDYSGPVPEGMEIIDLPPCKMMVFQSRPYQDEEMGKVCGMVQEAIEAYSPELYGFQWADGDGPRFQLAPIAERGYIEARPVRAVR